MASERTRREVVARLEGAAGADGQASSEGQRRDGAPAHGQQLSVTAGADDSDRLATTAVDDTTSATLSVAVVAHKGGRKNKKDLSSALKKEISIWICRKSVDLY
ncbi:hypothetical protein Scep_017446 [Stephania cephalantha]|uniref:Uncharacterized protein n=1 Tax=Stephania cephalantha TaxID=152367 RepID=A0AAP0IPH8_9MAGN